MAQLSRQHVIRRKPGEAMSPADRIACIAGLVVVTGVLMSPGSAGAGTAMVIDDPRETEPENVSDVVLFRASQGERNVIIAEANWDPDTGDQVWRITDAGAATVALPPCRAEDAHTVVCVPRPDHYTDRARFELGDAGDRFRTSTPSDAPDRVGTFSADGGPGDDRLVGASDVNILDGGEGNDVLRATAGGELHSLRGGPGDDRLWGHRGSDELDGGGGRDELYGRGGDDIMTDGDREGAAGVAGPGPDLFDGGSDGCCLIIGGDRVSYRGRSAPVHVDLSGGGTGGQAGEADVLLDIESVEGGSGDDRLFGDRQANWLIGRPGRDLLVGRGGDDAFIPGIGGGRVSCGAGEDVAGPPSSRDRLAFDCETIAADGPGGDYRLPAHPAVRPAGALGYTVRCPYNESDESSHLYLICGGTLHVREASKGGRLLAVGDFPDGRWEDRRIQAALTPIGKRLVSRRGGVSATMKLRLRIRGYGLRWTSALRWSIRLGSETGD